MITTTSLKHPTMQIKIKSVRVQAEHLGLIGKVYNAKGRMILVAVKYEGDENATFYAVDKAGIVGKDVTDVVAKAVPYTLYVKPKTFFNRIMSVLNTYIGIVSVKLTATTNTPCVHV